MLRRITPSPWALRASSSRCVYHQGETHGQAALVTQARVSADSPSLPDGMRVHAPANVTASTLFSFLFVSRGPLAQTRRRSRAPFFLFLPQCRTDCGCTGWCLREPVDPGRCTHAKMLSDSTVTSRWTAQKAFVCMATASVCSVGSARAANRAGEK